MNFLDFLAHIPQIKTEVLPAEAAHLLLMPPERAEIMKNLDLKIVDPRKAAVMMLFS